METVHSNITSLVEHDETPFRAAPHNIEAEQALLGASLVNNDACDKVSSFLKAEHFFYPLHWRVYEAALKLISVGKRASPITLKTFFEHEEPLSPDLTVPQYLGRLAGNATTVINAEDYGRTVYDLAIRRDLILIGEDMVNLAYDSPVEAPPAIQIEDTEQRLFELAETGKYGSGFEPFTSALTDAIDMAANAYRRDGGLSGIATGFKGLDEKMGGLQPSDLLIIAGRPSMGKTALATNIAYHVARAYKSETRPDGTEEVVDGAVVGFFSLEMWGGATFDTCIRFLNEDPWERCRLLKKKMPNTPFQMLLRGQNCVGYRHYADDIVERFVKKSADVGINIFRIFDALNDLRNIEVAVKTAKKCGGTVEGCISYTVSPVHNMDLFIKMAKGLVDIGSDILCIKDMAGLLRPYTAEEMVSRIKESCAVPLSIHCHATTGLSTATLMKAIDAGIDMIDTSISSMSLTYGHSPTETFVSIFEDSDRATGLDLSLLEEISLYFRDVRKKYAEFEGSLKGVDPRILTAQVPGGMLTNLEHQLRDQNAIDKLDDVLREIPSVRKDLGYVPLVTPTSQIVGTQAVSNVLSGERYKSITKETAGVLKGEYGATAAAVNKELQARVLDGNDPITCRPADLIEPEMERLGAELKTLAKEENIKLAQNEVEDVLIYALFHQVGIKFLKNRGNADAFEPAPGSEPEAVAVAASPVPEASASKAAAVESYRVSVNGIEYDVVVGPGNADISQVALSTQASTTTAPMPAAVSGGTEIKAPLAGSIIEILVSVGQQVKDGDPVIIIEAMKMETEIRSHTSGSVQSIAVNKGDAIKSDQPLMTIG